MSTSRSTVVLAIMVFDQAALFTLRVRAEPSQVAFQIRRGHPFEAMHPALEPAVIRVGVLDMCQGPRTRSPALKFMAS